MNNLVVTENKNTLQVLPKQEQLLKLIKETYAKGASDEEVEFFAQVCIQQNLDPIKRQIYFTKIWDSSQQKNCFAPIVSIDGMRSKAEETGLYAGQTLPLYCGRDGIWREVWADKEPPFACKLGIYRKDFKEPIFAIAYWDAYAKKTKEGKLTKFWAEMGPNQIAKCAEALALRKACPQKLSGLYSKEEMDNVIDVEKVPDHKSSNVHAPLQIQKENVAKVENMFNATNDFNSKTEQFLNEVHKLEKEHLGKHAIDADFEENFHFEFMNYFKDEYIKSNAKTSLHDLFFKKLAAKRLNCLALKYNLGRDVPLTEIEMRDLKRTVYEEYVKDPSYNITILFTEMAKTFIPF